MKIKHYLKLALHYVLLPFQSVSFKRKVNIGLLEFKPNCPIYKKHIVTGDRNMFSYFSDNYTKDGQSHGVQNMFVKSCIAYILGIPNEDLQPQHFRQWITMNTHGGNSFTNGTTFKPVVFDSSNVNLDTFAAFLLACRSKSLSSTTNFEEMHSILKNNGYVFNYVTDPKNRLSMRFKKELEKAKYENTKVKLPIPGMYFGLGCSADAAVVYLAFLSTIRKALSYNEYAEEFNYYYNTLKNKVKLNGVSSRFSTVVSLHILALNNPTMPEFREKLSKMLSCENIPEVITANINNYLINKMEEFDDKGN